jgi:hypothetical protein
MPEQYPQTGFPRLICLDGDQSDIVEFSQYSETKQQETETQKSDQSWRSQGEKAWPSNP